jgi:hypothetical protein
VRTFSIAGVALGSFFAYDPSFSGGVYVAGGNVTGEADPEVITGAGDSGPPDVRVFSTQGVQQSSFAAFQTGSDHGARVAAAHVPGGAVVVGSGTGGQSAMRVVTL